jgi:hypothetical protein
VPLFYTHFFWQWVMDLTTRVAGSPHLQDDLRGRQEVTDTQTDRQDIKNRYVQVDRGLILNLAGMQFIHFTV